MRDDTTICMPRDGKSADRADAAGPGHATYTDTGDATGAGPEKGAADTVPSGRAAAALELRRGEFELAVDLGHVRTTPGRGAGRRRVTLEEIARLREADGFPEALRERVRTVGTAEAAQILSTTSARFTRLARTGHLTPVRFRLNRYRAVVWLYLASEVREFAERNADLLVGKLPPGLRAGVDEGEDWRARNWRGRRLAMLLRLADGPWARSAAIASLLDAALVAETVDDPHERTHLARLRPEAPYGRTESPAMREITDRLLLADDPDEIVWHRTSLRLSLDEARASGPAPRPAADRLRLPGPGGSAPALPIRPGSRAVDSVPAPGSRRPGVTSGAPVSGAASDPVPRPRPEPGARSVPGVRSATATATGPGLEAGSVREARHRAPAGRAAEAIRARWRRRGTSPSRVG